MPTIQRTSFWDFMDHHLGDKELETFKSILLATCILTCIVAWVCLVKFMFWVVSL